MRPDSTTASNITVATPVDIARFRFAAYADESEYPDAQDGLTGLFTDRLERAVEVVESMTGLALKRGTYAREWRSFPRSERGDRDLPMTYQGFHAAVSAVEWIAADGTATALDADTWTQLPASEVGSVEIVPRQRRWDCPEGYDPVEARGIRVTGTAGCDLTGHPLPGKFFEALALVFRHLWLGDKASMANAERLLNRWTVAGSTL